MTSTTIENTLSLTMVTDGASNHHGLNSAAGEANDGISLVHRFQIFESRESRGKLHKDQ